MSATFQRLVTVLIAILVAVMLVWYWRIGATIFSGSIASENHLRVVMLVVAHFVLNIAAIIGLIQLRSWRTLVTCIAIIFSTIFFSTSYLPFIYHFIAKAYHPYLLIGGNIIVLALVILARSRGR